MFALLLSLLGTRQFPAGCPLICAVPPFVGLNNDQASSTILSERVFFAGGFVKT